MQRRNTTSRGLVPPESTSPINTTSAIPHESHRASLPCQWVSARLQLPTTSAGSALSGG